MRKAVAILVPVALVVAAATALAVGLERHARASVRYRGRDYVDPSIVTAAEVRADWAPLRDMHTRTHGMELFVPTAQTGSDLLPTVVLLRRGDGSFRLYELSGGP